MTLLEHIKLELRAILTNPVVTLTVFGGVLFYSFLYPLPYTKQVPRELPIAVVNLDKSQTSYQLERMVDATPNVTVVSRLSAIADAKQWFEEGRITGFIVIPEHFYKDLMMGKSPVLSYAGDAALFLVYGTVVEGLAQAGGTLAAKTKVSKLLIDGVPLELAAKQYAATELNAKPTFNPHMGYIDYVVPAVFVLILQQTLAMASGLIGGTQRQGNGYWQTQSPFRVIAVRTGVLLGFYYILGMFYFGASFDMYGISKLAHPSEMLTLMLPFFLTTCFIGILVGAITPRRELVTVLILLSSMPLIFSAGFIWPSEMLPAPMQWFAAIFPTEPAINGFLKLNQMGADWSQVSAQWSQLWLQAAVWGGLAYWSFSRNRTSNTN